LKTAIFVKNEKDMATEMMAAPPKSRIPQPKLLTYDDYVRLTPPDSGNYELHNGQIIYIATPIPPHQRLSMRLSNRLFNHIEPNKLGEVFTAPMDTVFTSIDTFQPDILFLSNERLHLIGDKKIEGAPDLVVEILSPSNTPKEMRYKKMIYEMTNVKEYWVVNLDKQILTQYENIEGEFVIRQVFKKTDTLTSFIIDGFEVSMSWLLG
jgi:Uma2 family endonuclease